ncbi:MAG: TIGR03936 family radical SAM-associated protein, partial [Desulfovermiculus sp.]
LPWAHINCGVRPSFLLQEREKARQEAMTPDCRYQGCSRCGVCTLPREGSKLARQEQLRTIHPIVNQDSRDQEGEHGPMAPARSKETWEQKTNGLVLTYAKKGPAAFLSQLELQAVFERLFRRAALPLSFTRGFHPMPRLSFGRALPVGVNSEEETCMVALRSPCPFADVCSHLNRFSVPGLTFTEGHEVQPGYKLSQPRREQFFLCLKLSARQSEQELQRWQELFRADTWTVLRQTKKGARQVDLRSRLYAVEVQPPDGVIITFDWDPGYLSPLFFVHILHPDLDPRAFSLTKLISPGNG